MASGNPILAAVPDGDARDFLQASGTALICRPDDSETMCELLRCAYVRWKANASLPMANRDFLKQFERQVLTERLARGFDGILRSDFVHEAEPVGSNYSPR
jgi:hypothetical protein